MNPLSYGSSVGVLSLSEINNKMFPALRLIQCCLFTYEDVHICKIMIIWKGSVHIVENTCAVQCVPWPPCCMYKEQS